MDNEIKRIRRSKAESQLLIKQVVKDILKGVSYTDLCRNLIEQYKYSKRHAEKYYTLANKIIKHSVDKDIQHIYEKQMSRYNQNYNECDMIENQKDRIQTRLKVVEGINKICGLETTNVKHLGEIKTNPMNIKIVNITKEELEKDKDIEIS